jgi:hypothetical protein
MAADDDAAADERDDIEVANVLWRVAFDAEIEHLVEVAVVEPPVPAH